MKPGRLIIDLHSSHFEPGKWKKKLLKRLVCLFSCWSLAIIFGYFLLNFRDGNTSPTCSTYLIPPMAKMHIIIPTISLSVFLDSCSSFPISQNTLPEHSSSKRDYSIFYQLLCFKGASAASLGERISLPWPHISANKIPGNFSPVLHRLQGVLGTYFASFHLGQHQKSLGEHGARTLLQSYQYILYLAHSNCASGDEAPWSLDTSFCYKSWIIEHITSLICQSQLFQTSPRIAKHLQLQLDPQFRMLNDLKCE